VTWNVGPHAEHEPYGPNHQVAFVSRNSLLAGAHHPHNSSEMERHANKIGQQMERGDVIQIPHVKFEGGRPVIGPEHHGAIEAAGRLGAEKVPIVVNKKNAMDLMMHVGEVEKPGPAKAGQDKRYKWRWNGRAWYTKPSFNNGQCPPGTGADANKDQCLGGGPAPASQAGAGAANLPPAHMWGPESLPAELGGAVADGRRKIAPRAVAAAAPAAPARARGHGVAPGRRRIEPRQASPRSPGSPLGPVDAKDLPPPLPIDRSQPAAGKVKLPPGYGLAPDTLRHRMDYAIGAYDGYGGQRQVTLEPQPDDTYENTLTKESLVAARDEVTAKDPTIRPGRFFGAGAAGAVFEAPPLPDGSPAVYKFDAGPYEARMADAVMKAGLVGKEGLGLLPRYVRTMPTSQTVTDAKLPLFLIEREDLADADKILSSQEMSVLGDYDKPTSYARFMHGLLEKATPKTAPPGVDPNDIGGQHWMFGHPLPWAAKSQGSLNYTRSDVLKEFDSKIGKLRARAKAAGGRLADQWDRIERESRKMLENGIIPCDLHQGNWGIREKTGEITFRDVGCAMVVDK